MSDDQPNEPIFRFGTTVMSPGVINILPSIDIVALFNRHIQGDWGDLSPADRIANEAALAKGGRLMSAYNTSATTEGQIIVFTEADRQYTTFCLPSEY